MFFAAARISKKALFLRTWLPLVVNYAKILQIHLRILGQQEAYSGCFDSVLQSSPGVTLIIRPSDNMYHISSPAPPSEAGGLPTTRNLGPSVMSLPVRLRITKKNNDPAAITATDIPPIRDQGTAITPAIGVGVGVTVGVVDTFVSVGAVVGAIVSAAVDAGSSVGVIKDVGAAVGIGDSSGLGVAIGLGIADGMVPPPPPPPVPPPTPPGG